MRKGGGGGGIQEIRRKGKESWKGQKEMRWWKGKRDGVKSRRDEE